MYYKKILLLSLAVFTSSSLAEYVPGTLTRIKSIDTYHHGAAEGDIRILVYDTVPGCEAGYFIDKSNLGISSALSIALSAFHSNTQVKIGGQSNIDWHGSSNPDYCKVHAITLSE